MLFSVRPSRHLPVQYCVTHNAGRFRGQCTIWNLSYIGWRFSGDLPMLSRETLSLTVTLTNEPRMKCLR